MSSRDEKNENSQYRGDEKVNLTYSQVKELLGEHRQIFQSQINDEIDRCKENIDDRISTMSTSIISGFEKVGNQITSEMKEYRQTLLPSATNVGKVDVKVIMPIIYTLCAVITAMIIWFTGVKPFIPGFVARMEQVPTNEQSSESRKDPN